MVKGSFDRLDVLFYGVLLVGSWCVMWPVSFGLGWVFPVLSDHTFTNLFLAGAVFFSISFVLNALSLTKEREHSHSHQNSS